MFFYAAYEQPCYCADNYVGVTPDECTGSVFQLFAHSAAQASAGLSRRNERLSILRRRQEEAANQLCPSGLTPCRVPDTSDGYEVRFRTFSAGFL